MKVAPVIASVLALAFAAPLARASGASVAYADGRLTARLRGADLVSVLQDVARQAGLEIRGMPAAPKPVTIRLDDVPLEDALPRLLAGHNFALTYGPTGLRGVRLLNGPQGDVWVIPPGAPGWTEPPPPEKTGALAASHRPYAIGGRLARALGTEETTFTEIMRVATQDPDARVRADAMRVGLRILEAEPELRRDLVQALRGYDDAAVARWLASAAGEHAVEVARRAARYAGSDAIRARAAAVERLL